MKMLLWKSDII